MLSMLAFQAYWIKNAVEVKREEFDRKVIEVLNSTIQKIEKQEVIYIAKQRLLERENKSLIRIAQQKPLANNRIKVNSKVEDLLSLNEESPSFFIDKVSGNIFELQNPVGTKNDILKNRVQVFRESEREFLKYSLEEELRNLESFRQYSLQKANNQDRVEDLIKFFDEDIKFGIDASDKYYSYDYMERPPAIINYSSGKDWLAQPNKRVKSVNSNSEKARFVKDVFTDFIKGKRNIHERLGHLMLDTLLHDEFKANGINLDFDYSVKDNGNIVFASFNKPIPIENQQKAYRVRLFPRDTYQQEQYLSVYFPEKGIYIFKNLWSVLGSSLILLVMVGGIFYFSVNTMLNQKKLSNIKNDFINNMTHELKTPVATIGLALEVIKDKSIAQSVEKTSRYLGIIEDENKRLGKQVERVLNIAQLERGDVKLVFETLDFHDILQEATNNFSIQIEQLNAEISMDLTDEKVLLKGDQMHLTNIVINLLDNAIKYSSEIVKIELITKVQDDKLYFSIKDNGLGIPKEDLNKIFDKFYRVPKGNLHDVKGFGLGLSYVKNMLELHKGGIKVTSKIGEGSTFNVYLPLA